MPELHLTLPAVDPTLDIMSLIAPLRRQLPRALQRAPLLTSIRASRTLQSHYQPFSTSTAKMSFSNTDTGSKPADPYTAKNLEQPDTLKEKVGDLITFVDKSKYCMMTTRIASSGLLVSRCMALAAKEGNGIDLIFHANSESGKTDDLESDNDINLAFLQPSGEWASISGIASIETDREKVRKYYSPGLKAWLGDLGDGKHDGGPEDPRIILIKVKAKTAQYAITRSATGALGNFVEFAKGVATGETAQVNKLRYLDESELQQWRTSSQ
ncbi:protein bli-3 [Aureobasidium pullulans]|uniref:Protein bli-3 n=1 Tax=Aureobasidium pullulans TaxID=5580 RepID=A0A4S8YQD5_AURPU|nr:protein bli-3 [Aureobasidium pullulans]THW54636.1 protein bli-3 [Aureobasidium pullulans]